MNRFDRIIWRVNGILILSVGIIIGVISIFASYKIYKETFRERHVPEVVNINAETKKEEKLYLERFSQVDGRPYLIGFLYSTQNYEHSYYSKSSRSLRNILYFNEDTKSSQWLLDSHDWLILDHHEMFNSMDNKKDRKVESYVFEVINKDSNQDGFLDEEDKAVVLVADFNGENLTTIEEKIDDILYIEQKDLHSFILIFNRNGKIKFKEIDLQTGKEVGSSDLISISLPH